MSSVGPPAELTSEYAATRKQFDKSLAEFGMIQVSGLTSVRYIGGNNASPLEPSKPPESLPISPVD